MSEALFITWTEQEQVFSNWRVVSGLGTEPVFETKTIRKYARWSNNTSKEMRQKAELYIQENMQDRPDAKVVIKEG